MVFAACLQIDRERMEFMKVRSIDPLVKLLVESKLDFDWLRNNTPSGLCVVYISSASCKISWGREVNSFIPSD